MDMETICGVVDFDGFSLRGHRNFLVREAAFVPMDEEMGDDPWDLISFDLSGVRPKSTSDRNSIRYCRRYIHGLPFEPIEDESLVVRRPDQLQDWIEDRYERARNKGNEFRNVVAYKGGHVERDVLQAMGIPCMNLEVYGCPKYEVLVERYNMEKTKPCFRHDGDGYHCALAEVKVFRRFVIERLRSTTAGSHLRRERLSTCRVA